MSDMWIIRHIEDLSMNAWPALQVLLYDGWVLRFADGYTKRANSVNPLYFSTGDVEKKLRSCERYYQSRGLDVVFKMTALAQPENLDAILVERGYRLDSLTSVQTLDLTKVEGGSIQNSTVSETLSEDWLADCCRLSNLDERRRSTLQRMLSNLVPQPGFASLRQDGHVIACGMGIAQDGYVGLFDIVTDTNFRRQGFGKQLVLNILAWGKRNGAHTAYLQVMLNNEPALRLYSGLGFKEIYTYWYRIKQKSEIKHAKTN